MRLFAVTKISYMILFREIFAVYSEVHTAPIHPPAETMRVEISVSYMVQKWVFTGVRSCRGVGLTPNAHLECRGLRKSRAIPLLILRAFVDYKKDEHLPT